MIANLRMTIQESIRYRGRSGHYSWLAHRLTGLGILFFLIIHTWDTANVHWSPGTYAWSIALFKNPFFGLGEIAIFGCVLFHGFNGIRITILDFKPEWWHYQAKSAIWVWGLFLILFVPAAIYLLYGIVVSCGYAPTWEWAGQTASGNSCFSIPPWGLFH